MSEWHTHYPIQSGERHAQVVTTHPTSSSSAVAPIDVAARCETCGAVMETKGLTTEDAALHEAKRLLADHATQCPGPSEAA